MEEHGRPEREDGDHRARFRGERHVVGGHESEEGDGGGDAHGQHRVLAGHRHRPVHSSGLDAPPDVKERVLHASYVGLAAMYISVMAGIVHVVFFRDRHLWSVDALDRAL